VVPQFVVMPNRQHCALLRSPTRIESGTPLGLVVRTCKNSLKGWNASKHCLSGLKLLNRPCRLIPQQRVPSVCVAG